MIKEQKVGVLALIEHDGKYLAVKRNKTNRFEPGKWGFIGEAIEYDEDIIAALKRGVKEETSLEITTHRLFNVYSRTFTSQYNDKERHLIIIAFICGVKNPNVKLNHELEDFKWTTLEEMKGLDLIEGNEKIIDELISSD